MKSGNNIFKDFADFMDEAHLGMPKDEYFVCEEPPTDNKERNEITHAAPLSNMWEVFKEALEDFRFQYDAEDKENPDLSCRSKRKP